MRVLEVENRLKDLEDKYSHINSLWNAVIRLEKKLAIIDARLTDLDPDVSDKLELENDSND